MKARYLLLLLLLNGCCHHGALTVKHQYLDSRYLASSYVETPDPRRGCFFGQQLIVNWDVPFDYLKYSDLRIVLTVRLGTQEVEAMRQPIDKRRGRICYRLMGDQYCDKGGIVTYKVEIWGGECLLECWKHQVWTQLIEFPDD